MKKIFENYLASFNLEALAVEVLGKIVALFFLSLFFFLAKKAIHYAVKRLLSPSLRFYGQELQRQKTLLRLMENILNYLLYFFAIYEVLVILGLPVGSLLAGAGIAGVAIGLGAQGFLSDVVNGFFILIEHQFDVGDSVKLTNGSIDIAGQVASMGIRTTQVRDFDGTLHFIPNRNITVVSNLSRGEMRVLIDLPLYARVDLDRVEQVIAHVNAQQVKHHPEIVKAPVIWGPQTSTSGQFSFRVALYVENGAQIAVYHTFFQLYQAALLEAGIELPTLMGLS